MGDVFELLDHLSGLDGQQRRTCDLKMCRCSWTSSKKCLRTVWVLCWVTYREKKKSPVSQFISLELTCVLFTSHTWTSALKRRILMFVLHFLSVENRVVTNILSTMPNRLLPLFQCVEDSFAEIVGLQNLIWHVTLSFIQMLFSSWILRSYTESKARFDVLLSKLPPWSASGTTLQKRSHSSSCEPLLESWQRARDSSDVYRQARFRIRRNLCFDTV